MVNSPGGVSAGAILMALRITKAERAELVNLTRNANAKRRRLIRRGIPESQIPFRFGFGNLTTRAAVNEYKQSLRSFTNRYNPNYQYILARNGTVFTEAQRNELRRAQRNINRTIAQRQSYFKSLPYNITSEMMLGVPPSAERTVGRDRLGDKTLDTIGYSRDIETFRSVSEYNAYLERIRGLRIEGFYLQSDTTLKDNFIQSLVTVFGSDAADIIAKVEQMPIGEFIEKHYSGDSDITFVYGAEDYNRKLAELRYYWL